MPITMCCMRVGCREPRPGPDEGLAALHPGSRNVSLQISLGPREAGDLRARGSRNPRLGRLGSWSFPP
jgi:hypothetical protein